MHDKIYDYISYLAISKKIFSKMLDYFRNFQKLNPSKISRYTVSSVWLEKYDKHSYIRRYVSS